MAARFAEARRALARGAGPIAELGRLEAAVRALVRGEVDPAATDAAPADERAADASLRALAEAPSTVLLVDADGDASGLLVAVLRMEGCSVEVAHDARAALSRVARVRPGVILVDVGAPGVDPAAFAAAVRERLVDAPEPLLVAMSARPRPDERDRAHAAGFAHYLVKPVGPRVVARLLRRAA